MSIIDNDFTPQNIQQLKELAKHVHHGHTPEAAPAYYKNAVEKHLLELSHRIHILQKSRDEFIAKFDHEIKAQKKLLADASETFTALLAYMESLQANQSNSK